MVKLYPLWSVRVTLRRKQLPEGTKSKAAHQPCLHNNFSSPRTVWNLQLWAYISSTHTASSDSVLTYSVSGCRPPLGQSERLLTKKVMWRTRRSRVFFFFSSSFNMKGVTSCRGMPRLKWASSICGCVMVWKNNCAAPYKEAVCTLITVLMLLWQAAVMGREVNAS